MANVPNHATDIRFISGVPFFNNYMDTRYFASNETTQQQAYFNAFPTVHRMQNCTIQRTERGASITVDVNVDKLYHTNYVVFRNPDISDKWFYAFVNNIEYVDIHTTEVYIEIDVLQTWLKDVTIKPSYIEREHTKLWDGSKPVVNTIKEGLNYGSEYDVVEEIHIQPSHLRYIVFVCSKQIAYSNSDASIKFLVKGGLLGSPTPLYYYIMPLLRSTMEPPDQIGGTNTVNINALMQWFATDTEAVNALQACYITDYLGIPFDEAESTNIIPPTGYGMTRAFLKMGTTVMPILYMSGNINTFYKATTVFINKYRNLKTVTESKLYMYPYVVYELQDLKGNILTFQPEYVDGDNINITIRSALGYTNKISYEIGNYNNTTGKVSAFQYSIIDTNPNDIPIVTDYLSAFLQGNRNSIQARVENAQMQGVTTGLTGMTAGLASTYSGLTSGNLGSIASGASQAFNGILQGTTQVLTEMNATNAQFEDAENIPPSVNKMGGNTAFDYGNGFTGVRLIKKQIKSEYIQILESYFKKYGYKVNKIKVPNLRSRQHFNFVKTIGITTTGNINNQDMAVIKRIFDTGVTLWHTDDIGNYFLGNEVR